MQIVTNKAIEVDSYALQQLDSISNSGSGEQVYPSMRWRDVANQLLTLQITLPADKALEASSGNL
ncbi:MAG: hypothetical protein ACR5K7_01660 [Symbiopectobacterium sp.]